MIQPNTLSNLIFYSFETICFGMVCVLYAFCVFTLWGQKYMSCRILLFINTLQFLLCVVQLVVHTIYLFIVFTIVTDTASYARKHNPYVVGSIVIYNISFIVSSILSIWRLYVLYDNNIRVCIPAFIFWLAQISMSGMLFHFRVNMHVPITYAAIINLLSWVFITTVNLCVAIPISIRLYIAQKKTHGILGKSRFKSFAIILIECGALITLCSIVMMVLQVCAYVFELVTLGIATDVAVASQLLITGRYGMLHQTQDDVRLTTPVGTSAEQEEEEEVLTVDTESSSSGSFQKELKLGRQSSP